MNPDSNATSTVEEIDAIQKLMSDLEQRLHRLSGATKRELSSGSADVRDFVTDALSGIMGRVREGAHSVSESATDKATHVGSGALKKLTDEMEQHPLTLLAIATAIGFIFGMSRR